MSFGWFDWNALAVLVGCIVFGAFGYIVGRIDGRNKEGSK